MCETWLEPHHTDPKIPLHRADRDAGPRGGTAIYAKESLKHSALAVGHLQNLETVGITANGPPRLFACYNQPNSPLLEKDLLTILEGNVSVIAAGDFNAKHINWGCRNTNRNGRNLNTFTDQYLDIAVMAPAEPTHFGGRNERGDILDIAIAKNVIHQIRLTAVNDLC